ncbi:extracellular solute-binding protein [Paenibacillus sp. YIM B09110]|uniref:extracellular solute-binding protein n=1 Tax=Paenibacillus sp. YIM B09110 TaxID=3126102 RepID=UPI00301C40B1
MGNKKTKKTVSSMIAMGMVVSVVLGGCSSGNNNEAPNATNTSTAAPEPTETAEPTKEFVDISWYMRKPIDTMNDQEAIEAEANKAIKEAVNANLHFTFIDAASWEDKMKLMSASGEKYDLVFTSNWTNPIDTNVQKGAFLPLDDLLKEYGQDILAKVDERAWKAVTYNGKIMAVPSQSPFTTPQGIVFKKDLVEKYNVDYKQIKNLKDLEPYLETIKKNEPTITPLLVTKTVSAAGDFIADHTIVTKGIRYDEIGNKLVFETDIPQYVDNYRTMHDYYLKGYVAKDAAVKTDFTAEAKSGKYAVMRDSGGYTEDGSKSTALFGFPTVESLVYYPIISTSNMVGAATAISKTSKNPERAMELLNAVWKDKQLSNTLAFGLEGKNYTVKSGAGTDAISIEAKSGAEQTWAIWHNWLGPLWDQWDSSWNSKASLELMQKNNDEAKTSAILGFLFNGENVKSEIVQVNAVYAELLPILITGAMTDYDAFLADMKKRLADAGLDKIKAEAQTQLDAWKSQNQ